MMMVAPQDLPVIAERLPNIMFLYRKVTRIPEVSNHVLHFRCEFWGGKIWHHRLATLYLVSQVISYVLVQCVETTGHQDSIVK